MFIFIVTIFIIDPVLDGVWQILLFYIMSGIIMGIKIMLSLDSSPLPVKMLVLQVSGEISALPGLNIFQSSVYRHFCGI